MMKKKSRALGQKALKSGITAGRYQISELGIEQRCTKCDMFWPLDKEFYFRDAGNKTGFQHQCKACIIEKKRSAALQKKTALKKLQLCHNT